MIMTETYKAVWMWSLVYVLAQCICHQLFHTIDNACV